MNLRRATIDDISLLQHWDEQPHVIASDPNDDWNWEVELARDVPWREQLIAEHDVVERRQFGLDDCFVYRLRRGSVEGSN
jgi:hypothetical protein